MVDQLSIRAQDGSSQSSLNLGGSFILYGLDHLFARTER
jgi:hypothetical protein